jgi:phosphoglycolate phosphatase-like HAD superfamily hydrolase
LDLQRSWMIGHTTADVLAGQRAELGTILVKTGKAGKDKEFQVDPHFVENDFYDAVSRVNQFEYSLRV